MSNLVTSIIRTVVPYIVGAFFSLLASQGIELDPEASANLAAFLTLLFGGIYYWVARLLERRWPELGVLLGAKAQPVYRKTK